MRYFYFLLAGISLCASLGASANTLNGVVVIVNDSLITYDQIESSIAQETEFLLNRYRGQPQVFEQEREKIRTEKIQQLIERKLILNEFKTAGYNLPETFIDDAIKEEIHKNFYGDRARLTKTLQFQGITYETFRQQQRERIIVDYLRSQNISSQKILISPKKIEDYYNEHQDQFKLEDQVKLRVIVINQPAGDPPGTARKIAEEVVKKLDEGVSFIEMASIYSAGSYRSEGGDRGWIDRSAKFHPQLMKTAFSLKAGQRSGIIEEPEACYLLLVEDARPAHVKTLVEVRAEVEDTLKTRERDRLNKKWIERLKSKSFIRFY